MPYNLGLPAYWGGDFYLQTTTLFPLITVHYTTRAQFLPDTCEMVWGGDYFYGLIPVLLAINIKPWASGEGLNVFFQVQGILAPFILFQSTWRWHYGSIPLGTFMNGTDMELISYYSPPGPDSLLLPFLGPVLWADEP